MATAEGALPSATPDVIGSSSAPDVSTTAAPSPAPDAGTSSPDVKTGSTEQSVQTQEQTTDDPLAGFPSDTEIEAAVANKTPWAEMAARIKNAYSEVKPKFDELQGKFTPFEPILERFQTAEELQPLIELNDTLFGQFERDPESGQLIPAVGPAVDLMFQRD